MEKFDDFCETLFQEWLTAKIDFSQFESRFLTTYVPEPYYTIEEGTNTLYVLNYNPGYGLDIQL